MTNAHSHSDVVLDWNDRTIEAIRTDRTGNAGAGYVLAVVNASMYDAVNGLNARRPQEPHYEPYAVNPDDAPASGSRPLAAAAAAHEALSTFYSDSESVQSDVDDAFEGARDTIAGDGSGGNPTRNTDHGIEWGRTAARAVIAAREDDGFDDHDGEPYQACEDREGPGCYRDGPNWGSAHLADLDPWLIDDIEAFEPPGPPNLDCERYADGLEEVKRLGDATADRPDEQVAVAEFWRGSGGTARPPGRWILIAQELARAQDTTITEDARLFGLLGMAMMDAGIVTWHGKYENGFWRPRTAIHHADEDGNPRTEADPEWDSLALGGSPEYPSGLSAFGGAATRILQETFGDDVSFELTVRASTDTGDGYELEERTRSYDSLNEALDESSRSRVILGNHFPFTMEDSAAFADSLADWILENGLQPVDATPPGNARAGPPTGRGDDD